MFIGRYCINRKTDKKKKKKSVSKTNLLNYWKGGNQDSQFLKNQ